jgi:hypothetical protein
MAHAGWELWWLPQAEVVHYKGQSTQQVAERMHVQLYPSKAQFCRRFGAGRRARWFKRLVRSVY